MNIRGRKNVTRGSNNSTSRRGSPSCKSSCGQKRTKRKLSVGAKGSASRYAIACTKVPFKLMVSVVAGVTLDPVGEATLLRLYNSSDGFVVSAKSMRDALSSNSYLNCFYDYCIGCSSRWTGNCDGELDADSIAG